MQLAPPVLGNGPNAAAIRPARVALGALVVAALQLVIAARGGAQAVFAPSWTVSAEASGEGGSTWLDGSRAPRVKSKIGFLFGVSALRDLSSTVAAGAALRASVHRLELEENGTTWSGGTLAEYDLVAQLALRIPALQRVDAALVIGGGGAVLSSANDVFPFARASSVAPVLDVAATARLGGGAASRRPLSVVVRYGIVRMAIDDAGVQATSGWVPRITAGLRVSR